jgi:hypothetical protein
MGTHHMKQDDSVEEQLQFAEAIRQACIQAALDGYENAAMRGLCCEGAYEAAIGAIRMLNVHELVVAPDGRR